MEMISVRSITDAQRGQQMLSAAGIRSTIVRASGEKSIHGCGYGLKIYGSGKMAREILERAGVALPQRDRLGWV